MLWSLIQTEFYKLRKTKILSLIFMSPIIAAFTGFSASPMEGVPNEWLTPLLFMTPVHAVLLLPLITGVFSSFICRYEHLNGGWKQLLSMPVRREQVYLSKFVIVAALIAFNQLLFGAGWILVGVLKGFTDPIPFDVLTKSVVGGWIATLPLAAITLGVSMAWSSFGAPLALNVVFTLPNIMVANSEKFAPYYPWVQPFLTMIPPGEDTWGSFFVSFESIAYAILGSFVLFFICGLMYIRRKAV
jgi:lantibiotic transport system permease protein